MSDITYALEISTSLRADINKTLSDFFNSKLAKQGLNLTKHGQTALELLKEFSGRPAKRLRGSLAVIGYDMFHGQNRAAALQLSIAIELVQDYLLIVDDVMDRSKMRRGKPTVHEEYLDRLSHDLLTADRQHISNMLSINVGLLAQHMASDILSRIEESPEKVVAATTLFHRNIAATGYGQIEDLFNIISKSPDEPDILNTYVLKSSYYTFINPLQTGATLAGTDQATLEALHLFGRHAGVAFQLQDDIIGLFGDEKKTGKSNLDDVREGKMTVLMERALVASTKSQAVTIRAALGNPNLDTKEFRRVQSIVKNTGALDYAQSLARKHAKKAFSILDEHSDWEEKSKRFLRGIVEYSIQRDH